MKETLLSSFSPSVLLSTSSVPLILICLQTFELRSLVIVVQSVFLWWWTVVTHSWHDHTAEECHPSVHPSIHPSINPSVCAASVSLSVWGEDCCLVFDLGFSSSSSRLVCISKPPARALPALPDLSQCVGRVHSLLCPSCNLLLIFVSEGGWWCSTVSSHQILCLVSFSVTQSHKLTICIMLTTLVFGVLRKLWLTYLLSPYDCMSRVITHPAILSPDHPSI